MILFSKLKNDLALGNISRQDYVEKCHELEVGMTSGVNAVTLQINILFYRILDVKPFQVADEALLNTVNTLFKGIEALSCDPGIKNLLELWNLDNFGLVIGNLRDKSFGEVRIRESLGSELPIKERREAATRLISLHTQFFQRLDALNKIAGKSANELLTAHIISVRNRFSIAKEISYISFEVLVSLDEVKSQIHLNNIDLALHAYNIFIKHNRNNEAYQSLCNACELVEISRHYGNVDMFDLNNLLEIKVQMEHVLEYHEHELVFAGL
jgi:hypothetical protein